MNAARFARNLIEDGVDPMLAQPLAEHLAEEIERTVATKEHVELVVTREVQQLRVEMHQEFQRFDAQITQRLDRQMRWLVSSTIVLFPAMLGNILKDFLR